MPSMDTDERRMGGTYRRCLLPPLTPPLPLGWFWWSAGNPWDAVEWGGTVTIGCPFLFCNQGTLIMMAEHIGLVFVYIMCFQLTVC